MANIVKDTPSNLKQNVNSRRQPPSRKLIHRRQPKILNKPHRQIFTRSLAIDSSNGFEKQTQSNFQFLQKKLVSSQSYIQNAVEIDSRIKHGNPVFKGTRIPLYIVVEELADGSTLADIIEGYPALEPEQVKAGLDFVASLARIYND